MALASGQILLFPSIREIKQRHKFELIWLIDKITILARRPRGLRAKINLASKEMSVIFGCVLFGSDSGVARVFRVKIDGVQNAFYFVNLFYWVLRSNILHPADFRKLPRDAQKSQKLPIF